jgi:tetratricopeptide (TPR) repeat protein
MAAWSGFGQPFIGRVEAVGTLQRRFEDVRSGVGGVTLLVGDTGVGKSTLVNQLVQENRARGLLVLAGRAPAVDDPPPFSLIRSAIESAHDAPVLASGEARPFGDVPLLIGFAPSGGDGAFPAPVSIETRLLETLGGTPERDQRSQDWVLSRIAEEFLELTRRGPTVLILEDLHHADPSSLATVEFLAEQLKNQPLWILATSRPPGSLSEMRRTRLEGFELTTHARRLALRPMTPGEVADYLQMNDPSREFSPTEVARLHSETGGNPLLLAQFGHRSISVGETSGPLRADRPPIDEVAQETLDTAAVLGPAFTFDLLLRASGSEDEERLAETVNRLVGQGLLIERSGEVLEFPEDRLREEAYNLLPEGRRRLLHRRAGEAMETTGDVDVAWIYALARHFYLGHELPRSVKYNRMAAEIAERSLALDTAWEHYRRALESHRQSASDDLDDEAELVLGQSRVMEELGVLKESEEVLRDFLDQAEQNPHLSAGRRATLEVFLCEVLTAQGNLPATALLAQKVLTTPGLDDDLLVRVGALQHLGNVRYWEGRYSDALVHHTAEVELARRIGNPMVLAHARMWRAMDLEMAGDLSQAINEGREVTTARDRFGSVRESAMAHVELADMLADARLPPAERAVAIEEYATAIRFAEQAKDTRRIGWALYKTAELLCEVGRFDEASEKAERAYRILLEVGDHVAVANALKARGRAAMGRGDHAGAEADFLDALGLLQQTANRVEEIDAHLRLGQLALARGDREGARSHLRALRELDLPKLRPDCRKEYDALAGALGEGLSATDPTAAPDTVRSD